MSGLAKAFALFSGASAIGSITQVIKGKFSAILLGAEGIGILNLITSLWSLFSVVASLGFFNGLLRHLAPSWDTGDREAFRNHASSNTFVLMASSLLFALIGCFFSTQLSHFLFEDDGARSDLICLILIGIPFFNASLLYRAMLNATRSVSAAVKARIAADVLSVFVLITLLYLYGLKGAVLSYVALNVLYLGFTFYFVRKVLGTDMVRPELSRFSFQEVRVNIGFGLNGLIIALVGALTTILISRSIVLSLGADSNGLYMMAIKVATVYLGGLSATAVGYYFPTLTKTRTDGEMFDVMNRTWLIYLFVLPPIIVILVSSGELLMWLLFTAEFIPAAMLLLLILPGDLFRVSAETVGMALLVRKRLFYRTGAHIIWALMYVLLATILMPHYGLTGAAIAYLLSQVFNAFLHLMISKLVFGFVPARANVLAGLKALALVWAATMLVLMELDTVPHIVVTLAILGLWTGLSCFDEDFRKSLRKLLAWVRRSTKNDSGSP